MSQGPENLLESDALEDVLEEAATPPPVVVVERGRRARSWLAIAAVVAALALCGLLAYNWREARRLRWQAILAQREVERLREKALAEAIAAPLPDRPVAVAMDPSPAVAPPAPVAGPTAEAVTVPPSSVTAGRTEPPAPSPSPPTPGPEVAAGPPSPPRPPDEPPAGLAAHGPDAASPFEEVVAARDPAKDPARAETPPDAARADGAAVPAEATADPYAAAVGAATAPPAQPALPSLEEAERQIREEAARIRDENGRRAAEQAQELHTLHDQERRQFIDELEMTLKVHGRRAGPEVERLAERAGRNGDPLLLARARWVIAETKLSQRAKVRQLRALGVPETVILDYLANRLDKKLGTPDGPRTRDEVWVQAAWMLVRYAREAPPPTTPTRTRAAARPVAPSRPVGAVGAR